MPGADGRAGLHDHDGAVIADERQTRLKEMVQIALREGPAQLDGPLLTQAVALAEVLKETPALVGVLIREDWLPWPLPLLEVLCKSEDAAASLLRLWLCDAVALIAHHIGSHEPNTAIMLDRVRIARDVIAGRQDVPSEETVIADGLELAKGAHVQVVVCSVHLAGPMMRLAASTRRMFADDQPAEWRDLARMALGERIRERLVENTSTSSPLRARLCGLLWEAVDLSSAGEVIGIRDAGRFQYLLDTARRVDANALLSALSVYRWTGAVYLLLSALSQTPEAAEQCARQWAAQCLDRVSMGDSALLSQRSPSLLTLRCARAGQQAAEDPGAERDWQQRALMAHVAVLVQQTPIEDPGGVGRY